MEPDEHTVTHRATIFQATPAKALNCAALRL